jgi:hypothetical protein
LVSSIYCNNCMQQNSIYYLLKQSLSTCYVHAVFNIENWDNRLWCFLFVNIGWLAITFSLTCASLDFLSPVNYLLMLRIFYLWQFCRISKCSFNRFKQGCTRQYIGWLNSWRHCTFRGSYHPHTEKAFKT